MIENSIKMTSKPGGHNSNGCNNNDGGVGLENWRDYFRRANSDIFDIIEHAIMVAASDCPKEFRVRREKIAELLFTCRLTRCLGCDRVELAVSEVDDGEGEVKVVIKGVNDQFNVVDDDVNGGGGSKGSKGSKVLIFLGFFWVFLGVFNLISFGKVLNFNFF